MTDSETPLLTNSDHVTNSDRELSQR